ncbi:dolichyl-phosphate beta-glucosyltransferase [Tothia fuscella]|uniref:dolichyl-phosphate beta-glucosyltransferase n=1 Tax=Tothia fuscella TaxID=1048955 RepID=A0A9P4NXV8_9PEZI|nr:dolichyl-phosphate beta-glucosyltransferase [Tothia fuscella]
MSVVQVVGDIFQNIWKLIERTPWHLLVVVSLALFISLCIFLYCLIVVAAPEPRPPRRSEKQYLTVLANGETSELKELPCWIDGWQAKKELARRKGNVLESIEIEEPEIFMSVVVPAYNEEERMGEMLEEAVEFLQREYGTSQTPNAAQSQSAGVKEKNSNGHAKHSHSATGPAKRGWEIILVSDGSTDKTVETALAFAKNHQLSQHPVPVCGLGTGNERHSTQKEHGSIRIVTLEENRGKGGAVTHGMRHIRGQYAVFADADGASKFEDLAGLVRACQELEDPDGRAVTIGSRAHLVGSEAVVKRSRLRNFLMHCFHLLIRFMTPPATSTIKDTQCGFKLFSRASLPYIIPYMHSEGWIFDIEMLMLTESAQIPMAEVPVGWKEVKGSKLNVIWDSLGMAWGLAVLRAAWMVGVYRRV